MAKMRKQLNNRKSKQHIREEMEGLNEKLKDYFSYILTLEKDIKEKKERIKELKDSNKVLVKRIENMKITLKKKGA